MSDLRVGVIGVGHLGYHHARLYAALDGAKLVGVVDLDAERAAQVATEFACEPYASLDELLRAGVDAVSIAVPTSSHHATGMQVLAAGVDVLIEKPIACDVAQAEDLVALAKQHDRILQVGHVERFNGAVIALRQAVSQPRFIECHRLSPYSSRGADVSVVLDLMIHDLDILHALDQSEVVSLDAVGVSVFSGHEDIANARIRLASGCVANLTSSRVSMERMRKIRIFEPNAYMSTNYSEQEVLVYRKKPGPLAPDQNPMEAIQVEALPVTREEPLRLELESFLESVRTRTRPEVAGEDGLAALKLAQRIVDFIRENT